jgi:hypothetical protein
MKNFLEEINFRIFFCSRKHFKIKNLWNFKRVAVAGLKDVTV